MIQSQLLNQFPELVHGFSERQEGTMSRRESAGEANRAAFLSSLGIDPAQVVYNQQVHSSLIRQVGAGDHDVISQADGLFTSQPNTFLTVFSADCLPIFLYEPKAELVATLHAGWRGLSLGIIKNGIRAIKDLGGAAGEIRVWIGPHIQVCHYDLRPDLPTYKEKQEALAAYPEAFVERDDQIFLDLTKVAVRQLQEEGIESAHLDVSVDCPACQSERFYSYHANHGQPGGIMMGVIGRRED